ncbi:MAG TPA: permease [Croceibacterium sp.]|jgi:hypothetical protein|nr:permease [Croceibacterium sp.]
MMKRVQRDGIGLGGAAKMTPETANGIGFLGMVLIVSASALVTASKTANPYLVGGLDLVSAAALIRSLTVNRNRPSMVLASVWAVVALFGLGKARQRGKRV